MSGFLAKIGLLHAGIEVGTPLAWLLVVGGIVTSLLTLYALAKVWSQAFWRTLADAPHSTETVAALGAGTLDVDPAADPATAVVVDTAPRTLPRTMLGATAAMTAVGLAITLVAGPLFAYTQRAASDLAVRDPYITTVLPQDVRR